MINTKKMITLGVLAVTGLGLMGTTTAYAAGTPGSGQTTVTYVPGQSTGGGEGGDGSVSDWTVQYPKNVVLSDSTISPETGVGMTFKILKTNPSGAASVEYDGTKKVDVKISRTDSSTNTGVIGLKKNGSELKSDVTMALSANSKDVQVTTDQDVLIDTLTGNKEQSNKKTSVVVKAYLKDTSGLSATDPVTTYYNADLTWIFAEQD